MTSRTQAEHLLISGTMRSADAILWDFDGTLADSADKNMAITKQILAKVAPQLCGERLPQWLRTKANYHQANHGAENWRDLYREYFDMTDGEIHAAGPMWEEHQAIDKTAIHLFDGVKETLAQLEHIPMGISSANSSYNINRVLDFHDIASSFKSVVGYEQFTPQTQKPAAEPGLKCLDEVLENPQGKTIIYIGDHIADVIFSRNIEHRLSKDSRVISVIITHSGARPETWRMQPDVVIESPLQLLQLLK